MLYGSGSGAVLAMRCVLRMALDTGEQVLGI